MLQASPTFYGISNSNPDASVLDMMFDAWNDTPEQKQPARPSQVSHMMPQHQLYSTGSAPLPQQASFAHTSSGRARTTVAAMIEPDCDDGLLISPGPPSVSQPMADPGTSPGNTSGRVGKPGAPSAGESTVTGPEPGLRRAASRACNTDKGQGNGTAGAMDGGGTNGITGGAGSRGGGGASGGGGSKKGGKSGGSKGPKLVTRTDLRHDLTGRMLKLLWPDDNSWWDGQVASMALDSLRAIIFYSSTGEEEEVSLSEMVDKKELAWPPGESLSSGGSKAPSRAKSANAASKVPGQLHEAPQTHSKKKARPAATAAASGTGSKQASQGSQPQQQSQQQQHRGHSGAQPQAASGTSTLSGAGLASQAIAALLGGTLVCVRVCMGPALISQRTLVYKYPGMNGSQPSGWQYATVAGVQNGLLSVMYGPGQVEHLSPSNPGIAVRPPPQGPNSGW
ncbi:hypothetical protein DUNSADRAFT_5218 [Dunaliella salina]|uniref:Uncharacterized protein n=1 Tax=Dunaliella salina TaxID=3046 RepID=A0ABQ7GQQ5_DUNSA|nr:hypothetical protein DUNSADRAFT_5218 [Dunaliella salina]|eukprot:KAF5836941.1 hypothetical protein DUNSADRAFT_5218 [Dunaliella salina]